MILFFSDAHLGYKRYSSITENFIFESEQDARNALTEILDIISHYPVSKIIFCGDLFHSNKPTPTNIKWVIEWFHKLDNLGIESYFIVGNHDASEYSHAFVFAHSLNLKNITIIEKTTTIALSPNIHGIFIPFMFGESLQNKYHKTQDAFNSLNDLVDPTKVNIVISHLHEVHAGFGSEARMISNLVSSVNITKTASNLYYVFGHVHTPQQYKVGESCVYYPGALINMTSDDCEIPKYVLLCDERTLEFSYVPLTKIRKFKLIKAKTIDDAVTAIRQTRYPTGTVVFIAVESNVLGSTNEVLSELQRKRYRFGKIICGASKDAHKPITDNFLPDQQSRSLDDILQDYLNGVSEKLPKNWKTNVLPRCKKYLEMSTMN